MNASIGSLLQSLQTSSGQAQHSAALSQPNIVALDVVRQVMQTMTPSIDSLINQLLPIKTHNGKPAILANTQSVIEAKVLSSTLLAPTHTAHTKTQAPSSNPTLTANTQALPANINQTQQAQFQILISTGQQHFKLISTTALEIGSTLQLKQTENGLVQVLKANITSSQQPSATTTQNQPAETGQFRSSPNLNRQDALIKNENRTTPQHSIANQKGGATNPVQSLTTNTTIKSNASNGTNQTQNKTTNETLSHQTETIKRQVIDQGIRQALPKQQPLNLLLPVLQKLLSTTGSQSALPKELVQNIRQLLNQFPSPEKLQQAPQLKTAVKNSGIFFEAKLAQQAKQNNMTRPDLQEGNKEIGKADKAISSDTKALIQRLYQLIQQQPTFTKSATNTATETPTDISQSLLYTAKPQPPILTSNNPQASPDKNLDVVLKQLSQQLLSSIARTQFNQLETLANRRPGPDNPTPNNQWSLEIPIVNGNQVDNLQLHIQQEKIGEDEQERKKEAVQKWSVMLDFDLHHLGKMSVQLNIQQRDVSAVIWSQLQTTHREVHQHISLLQGSLENIGVNVKRVNCRLGIPPKNTHPRYRQLVDVTT